MKQRPIIVVYEQVCQRRLTRSIKICDEDYGCLVVFLLTERLLISDGI